MGEIRHSVRGLLKNPGFTLVAVLALALGIGANTAIFSVVYGVLLKPLPYPESDRMVRMVRSYPQGESNSISIPKFGAWKRHSQVFESMAAYDFAGPGLNLGSSADRPEQVKGIHVSQEFFRVFRAKTRLGRTFTTDEDRPGGPKVAILSHGLSQRRFGADPKLLDTAVKLNGELFTVIGVMEAGFESQPPADVWLPLQADPNSQNHGNYLNVAARLKPGVTLEQAQSQMKLVGEQTRKEYPQWVGKDEGVKAVGFQSYLTGNIRPALLMLLGAVGFVLLIACSNVANLQLARAASRRREIAVRIAIGAGRIAIVRQLITESLLLALGGGILGFLLGVWGVRLLVALAPGELLRSSATPALDPALLAFTLGLSLVTAVVFGLLPAMQISRPDLTIALRESTSRSGSSMRHNRTRSLLVVVEMALAVVLVIGAGLLLRTFAALRAVQTGFDSNNVLTLKMSLAGEKYETTAPMENYFRQLIPRLKAIPGVEAAAPSISLPLEGGPDLPFRIAGRPLGDGKYHGDADWRNVGAEFFDVLKVRVRSGRRFTERDTLQTSPVVIINEAMAKRYWPNQDPVGQRIEIGKGLGPEFDDPVREIIGVVSDFRERRLDRDPAPTLYIPIGQTPNGMAKLGNAVIPMNLLVRASGPPRTLLPAIEKEVQALDAQLAVFNVRTMEEVLAESLSRSNFNVTLLSVFAGIALLLATIGVYGLMSYTVDQRHQEMGIRMALGATPGGIRGLVMVQGAKLALIGVVLGLAASFGLSRFLSSMLFGVKAVDPLTFAGVSALLIGVAMIASYVPARRATKVDPLTALRYE